MKPWVEKYRPKKLNDVLLSSSIKDMLNAYLSNHKSIPNLMLSGTPGKGKTTLAEVLINELDCDYLYINASQERGIDIVRNKIIEFADCQSIKCDIKLIILDESDQMTDDAQKSLKNIIEKSHDDTRYIFTCNNVNKMDEAIRSRCTEINVSTTGKEVFQRIQYILENEKISYTKDDEKIIVSEILKKHWPDIRATIQHLESCCISGKFEMVKYAALNEGASEIVDIIFGNIKNGLSGVRKSREYWIQNSMKFSNKYDVLASLVFSKCLNEIDNMKDLDDINKYIVEFNHGAFDQEIIFTALINRVAMSLSNGK